MPASYIEKVRNSYSDIGMGRAEGLHPRQNLRMIAANWEFTSTLPTFETVAVVEQLT